VQRNSSQIETSESGSSGSHTDVIDSRANWLSGFSSAENTPSGDGDVKTTGTGLSVSPKMPLMATKSAPESLQVEPVSSGTPAVTPSVSASDSVSGASVTAARTGQKIVTQLTTARPTKCKSVQLHLLYTSLLYIIY